MGVRGVSGRKLRWTPLAYEDLKAARDYIAQHNAKAAREFAATVRAKVKRLQEAPEIGPVHPDLAPVGRYRYLVATPYIVLYRLAEEDVVLVLRVWDSRQDPDRLRPE